jgi:hypothetical protein
MMQSFSSTLWGKTMKNHLNVIRITVVAVFTACSILLAAQPAAAGPSSPGPTAKTVTVLTTTK